MTSYLSRHTALTQLLARDSAPLSSLEQSAPLDDSPFGSRRDRALDAALENGWTYNLDLAAVDRLRISSSDFRSIGTAGEGQFGNVDVVLSSLDQRVYAIKSVHKSAAIRHSQQLDILLERSILLLARRHAAPAPALFAAFQSANSLHLVMTFAPCGSLWDRLSANSPLDSSELTWWAPQLVQAIDWCHRIGIAHRDVKPHNLLIESSGHVLLTDFGSAASIDAQNRVDPARCALPVGTPDYIAPEILLYAEQLLSDLDSPTPTPYSASVDWWSFGATMYELSVGHAPFWADRIESTYSLISRCVRVIPAHLSTTLANLIARLLSPLHGRLGSSGVEEIHRHPFFTAIDWSSVLERQIPSSISLYPLDITSEHLDNDDHTSSLTFNHFFDSVESVDAEPVFSNAPGSRWLGWSFEPPPEALESSISPAQSAASPLTPMRPSRAPVPSTPRSTQYPRPLSGLQAMEELLDCVQKSARKKNRRAVSREIVEGLAPSPDLNRLRADQIHLDGLLTTLDHRFRAIQNSVCAPED